MKTADQFVYQCRWTGKHAFTLGTLLFCSLARQLVWNVGQPSKLDSVADVDLDALPMRRTDNARILDTRKHKLIKSALNKKKQTVRIRRKPEDPDSGCIELQHRQLLGKLPVAYTCVAACCHCR